MADPTTVNRGFFIPTRGSDPGTWDVPLNANWSGLDNMLGAPNAISASAGTITLTTDQISFGTLFLSGTLSGDATLLFPTVQGWWTIYNGCTVGAFALYVASGTGTTRIGIPPGEFVDVLINNNTPYYRSFGRVNGIEIWAGYSAVPRWCTGSTVPPYVLAGGLTYNFSVYPFSGATLGSSFGGDGITTFGVPDLRGRVALPYDGTGARITSAICGINGQTLGAAGGNQNVAQHAHTYNNTTANENQSHAHAYTAPIGSAVVNLQGGSTYTNVYVNTSPAASLVTGAENQNHNHNYSGTTATYGSGSSANIQPAQVTGIAVIRLA